MDNVHADQLVDLWAHNAIGAKEDFDVMVIDFLETLKDDVSIYEVLSEAKNRAQERVSAHAEDIALQLSHKAFRNSLEYQLQFWTDMAQGRSINSMV